MHAKRVLKDESIIGQFEILSQKTVDDDVDHTNSSHQRHPNCLPRGLKWEQWLELGTQWLRSMWMTEKFSDTGFERLHHRNWCLSWGFKGEEGLSNGEGKDVPVSRIEREVLDTKKRGAFKEPQKSPCRMRTVGTGDVGRGLSVEVLVNCVQIKMFEHWRIMGNHEAL